MLIYIFGSTSHVGKLIIPELLKSGHEVVSVGRSHSSLIVNRIHLEDFSKFDLRKPYLFLFLALDYSNISNYHAFEMDNFNLLSQLTKSQIAPHRLVVLGSDSASKNSKSHYGIFKYRQSIKIRELGFSEIKIGWLGYSLDRDGMIGWILHYIRKLPIDIRPYFRIDKIKLTYPNSLVSVLESNFHSEKQFLTQVYDVESDINDMFFGSNRPISFAFVRRCSGLMLSLVYMMRALFPRSIIRTIDSVRSLL